MRLVDIDALDWEEVEAKHGKRNEIVVDCEIYIESAPTVNLWIPCNERLPEVSGLYLVTTNAYGVWAARTDSYSVRDKDWKRKGDKKAVITAWMPLPEPYSIESDGIGGEQSETD